MFEIVKNINPIYYYFIATFIAGFFTGNITNRCCKCKRPSEHIDLIELESKQNDNESEEYESDFESYASEHSGESEDDLEIKEIIADENKPNEFSVNIKIKDRSMIFTPHSSPNSSPTSSKIKYNQEKLHTIKECIIPQTPSISPPQIPSAPKLIPRRLQKLPHLPGLLDLLPSPTENYPNLLLTEYDSDSYSSDSSCTVNDIEDLHISFPNNNIKEKYVLDLINDYLEKYTCIDANLIINDFNTFKTPEDIQRLKKLYLT